MGGKDHRERLHERSAYLEALVGDSLHKPELVDRLDVSRSTVDRAIRELEQVGFVEKGAGGHTATLAGELAFERYQAYEREVDDLIAATDALEPLSAGTEIAIDALVGSEVTLATESAPYEPRERVAEQLQDAETYRAVLPTLPDLKGVRLLYEHVVTREQPAELVVSPALLETLREEFPVRLPAMADADGFSLFVGDVPEFGVIRTEAEGSATVSVLAFGAGGSLHGLLQNESTRAGDWADHLLAEYRDGATDRTAEFAGGDGDTPADGGVPMATHDTDGALTGGVEPQRVTLEREGFVKVDREFLAGRSVTDPTTAWRAGLDLAEVQAGYAVERTGESDRPLAQEIADRLRAGDHCAVLGPPGSGKSTVCKRVACEWYREGDPVFYRESARGQRFESVDAVVGALERADGQPLVVVEDGIRPEASAVLDAIAALDDDAVVLLDARETEWQEANSRLDAEARAARNEIATVRIPSLSETEYERLVEHVERTTDTAVDIPVDQLQEEIGGGLAAEDTAPSDEMLLLLHRLSRYVDPLSADEASTLEAEVERTLTDLRGESESALRLAVLVSVLNASGVGVREEYLQALAEDIEPAVDRLEGRMLFAGEDGYRTVHESWSTEFLDRLIEVCGEEAAAEMVGQVVSAVLALADEADRSDDSAGPVGTDPREWAESTVEQLFGLGRRAPKLAVLLGETNDSHIRLPDACRRETRLRCAKWRGNAYHLRGDYERARREFEHLLEETTAEDERMATLEDGDVAAELRVDALVGLADAHEMLNDPEAARADADRALALAREQGDSRLVARSQRFVARLQMRAGDLSAAADQFEQALVAAREAGDALSEVRCLLELAAAEDKLDNRAVAREYNETAIERARELGFRKELNRALGDYGLLLLRLGKPDEAEEYFHRSLELCREMGDPEGEGAELGNLGLAAYKRGDYEAAEEYLAAALEIQTAMGNEHKIATTRLKLAETAYLDGDHDVAATEAEEALALCDRLGFERGKIPCRYTLAKVARARGNLETAEQHARRGRELAADVGDRTFEAMGERLLGDVERDRGELDAAETQYRSALGTFESVGEDYYGGRALVSYAELARERGDLSAARDRYERAWQSLVDEGGLREGLEALGQLIELTPGATEAVERCETGLERARDAGFDDVAEQFEKRQETLQAQHDDRTAT